VTGGAEDSDANEGGSVDADAGEVDRGIVGVRSLHSLSPSNVLPLPSSYGQVRSRYETLSPTPVSANSVCPPAMEVAPTACRYMSRAAPSAEVIVYVCRNPHKNKTFTTAVQGWLGNPRIEGTN